MIKPGTRAVGIAESGGPDRSTLAAAVVGADGVVDGLGFGRCTVGGLDATEAIGSILSELDRPDVRYVFLGAIAPAWYNILDLERIHETADRPVVAVTFEASDGLEAAIGEEFDDEERDRRLARYRSLPTRRPVSLHSAGDERASRETVYARSIALDPEETAAVVRSFTIEGGRPEPIRVARLAARAGREFAP